MSTFDGASLQIWYTWGCSHTGGSGAQLTHVWTWTWTCVEVYGHVSKCMYGHGLMDMRASNPLSDHSDAGGEW